MKRLFPMMLSTGLLLLVAIGCAGCERRTPTPRPEEVVTPDAGPTKAPVAAGPDAAVSVPKGCEINLGGAYHNPKDASFKYAVRDDGAHVTIDVKAPLAKGEQPMVFELDRTHAGLSGAIKGEVQTGFGKRCPVSFKAEIVACSAQGITVRAEEAYGIGDDCQRTEGSAETIENQFVRDPP